MGDGFLTLAILAVITAFLVMRLKSVLGTKTGFEKKPEPIIRDRDEAPAQASAPIEDEPTDPDDPIGRAIAEMREIEPDFDPHGFVDGAQRAYEMLLMAFENGDKATLETYLSPDVYQASPPRSTSAPMRA